MCDSEENLKFTEAEKEIKDAYLKAMHIAEAVAKSELMLPPDWGTVHEIARILIDLQDC
jgi:hypothetical protein